MTIQPEDHLIDERFYDIYEKLVGVLMILEETALSEDKCTANIRTLIKKMSLAFEEQDSLAIDRIAGGLVGNI